MSTIRLIIYFILIGLRMFIYSMIRNKKYCASEILDFSAECLKKLRMDNGSLQSCPNNIYKIVEFSAWKASVFLYYIIKLQ